MILRSSSIHFTYGFVFFFGRAITSLLQHTHTDNECEFSEMRFLDSYIIAFAVSYPQLFEKIVKFTIPQTFD